MDISFVIPCYCAEKNIEYVVGQIKEVMEKKNQYSYEVILVNDCSRDNTEAVIEKLVNENPNFVAINFAKNFGQPNALLAGFRAAKGDYIMTSDDDGQTAVENVWRFLEKIEEGYDVVCAKYSNVTQKVKRRRLGTKLNEFMLNNVLNKPKELTLSSFFMARRFVIEEICKYNNAYPYIAGLLLRTTAKIGNVEIEHSDRKSGKSGYNMRKLIKLWLNGFTAFSLKPLRFIIFLGLIVAFLGCAVAVYAIIRKCIWGEMILSGYPSIIACIGIIGGMNLCVLGVIAEYIGRIYMCINNQPQYVIKSITSSSAGDK